MPPFEIERDARPPARIKVIGIGGGGCNAVDGMMASGLDNVEFHALNTDIQALSRTSCPNRLQIGSEATAGLGCGGDPMAGERAASATKDQIREILEDADMVFLTAGLGGGTGTGATPVIAQMAKEANILTVAIVTRPFSFEGPQRMEKAQMGLGKLREYVDTLIVVTNDRLLEVVGSKATLLEAFSVANTVLAQGVRSISDLIAEPGLINLDFADVRAIMGERGGAVMGVGVGKGENRAEEAVKKACSSPLLDKIEIDGATGVLICIAGPPDLRLSEINAATAMVYQAAENDANIIFGAVVNEDLSDEMRVTIIATGFTEDLKRAEGEGKKEDEEDGKLTARNSRVSLRSKLEAMLAGQADKAEENTARTAAGAGTARAALREEDTRETIPPPPRFPEPRSGARLQSAAAKPEVAVEDAPPPMAPTPAVQPDFNRPESGATTDVLPDLETAPEEDIDFESIPIDARREVIGGEPTPHFGETSSESDYDGPAFLRRRRDLFE